MKTLIKHVHPNSMNIKNKTCPCNNVYPFFTLMHPTLFVLGMVGYNELKVRGEYTLAAYLFIYCVV